MRLSLNEIVFYQLKCIETSRVHASYVLRDAANRTFYLPSLSSTRARYEIITNIVLLLYVFYPLLNISKIFYTKYRVTQRGIRFFSI